MDMLQNFVGVPGILILCAFVGTCIKHSPLRSELIPCICGIVGCILGIIAFVTIPGYIPADNVITAAAVGVVSGLAATGGDQIFKQLEKMK